MKKFMIVILLCFSTLLSACSVNKIENNKQHTSESQDNLSNDISNASSELRGVWLSYLEISNLVKGKSESEYRASVETVVSNIKNSKLNTVFYQVRCFSDALYISEKFPSSKYIAEYEGDKLEYDPFGIFIEIANTNAISVHAWVNPFRVSYSNDIKSLSDKNPAKRFFDSNNKTTSLLIGEKSIYYNPADESARELILLGIRELIENYKIDGIQFDDYFYPEEKMINDSVLFKEYRMSGGSLSIEEWRKENINNFVASVYSLIKNYDRDLIFGISPSASLEHNEKIFADVKTWCGEEGFIDYVMPQIYYGFQNEIKPFLEVLEEWGSIKRCKGVSLYCGLASYKCGCVDENALSGKNEWVENSDVLQREYEKLSENKAYSGFSLYSYSYCFGENISGNMKKEIRGLTSML